MVNESTQLGYEPNETRKFGGVWQQIKGSPEWQWVYAKIESLIESDQGKKMTEHLIIIHLYANLKEKAGTNRLQISIPENSTVGDLKKQLKNQFPVLGPQLANVVVLINKHHIFIDTDIIPLNAEVTFLPPIAGG